MGYSSQYGWLAGGIFPPPSGASVWVRVLSQTAGLETYEGGMRSEMAKPLHTYAPLFGTGGSSDRWPWGGTMVHNWYAASVFGDYTATYEVYIGDSGGVPLTAYASDSITLNWTYVPEPAALSLLLGGGLVLLRRRHPSDRARRGR